ncbi:MFS transporter [Streptomyces sp. NRRL WC-3742]|uniref:MFS transporter n=1 Tax=Streptomyces sp. NRRL WC-3742 TaxID=1463934 RepID=UPI0004CA3513|nr:MFS transporter [Streptomyces sp. NRRL WC-3742]
MTTAASLPRPYLLWLSGVQTGLLGDAALYFALGWAASAYGGGAAGLVLTAITVPRTLLVLFGGAVADRYGVRRVLLAGDAVMLAATLLLAAAVGRLGTPLWLLVAAGAVIGAVDAFYLPASGSMPRRLVRDELLSRALALRQAGGQIAVLLGAPLGGLLVASGGLAGAALADAASFGAVLLAVLYVRPAGAEGPAGGASPGLLREASGAVRLALRDPLLRAALLLTGAAAGGLLPVVSLLGPLLARSHGWGAGAAGLLGGGQAAGVLAVAGLVAWRGALSRPGVGASAGLAVASAGTALLGLAADRAMAAVAAVVIGLGSGLFASHLGPLVLGGAPVSHLSRVQALLTLVQSAGLILANPLLGRLADATGPQLPTLICALLTLAAAVRAARMPTAAG